MYGVIINIQILSSKKAQRVSKNPEAFCKHQVVTLWKEPGKKKLRLRFWLTAHLGLVSALNLIILMSVNFCLPSKC